MNAKELVADSRIVAIALGKQHAHVIRSIERMLNSARVDIRDRTHRLFECDFYKDPNCRMRKMYRMTGDGLAELLSGMSGDAGRLIRLNWKINLKPNEQYLYVMAQDCGLCKVGIAKDVEKRRSTLEASSGHRISAVAVYGPYANARRLELTVHETLDFSRTFGEWFACSPKVAIQAIDSALELFAESRSDDRRALREREEAMTALTKAMKEGCREKPDLEQRGALTEVAQSDLFAML